jgi:uncharacterized DUF497 family protein
MKQSAGRTWKSTSVDFTAVHSFDWDLATRRVDARDDYGELRERAVGFIGAIPHVLIFTEREDELGSIVWVISLRKADKKERRKYGREIEI